MLTRHPTYAQTRGAFVWNIPDRYNIGVDICDKWAMADPDRLAIRDVANDGAARDYSFAALGAMAARIAHVLTAAVGPGDRVGILLPQRVETAATHVAVLRMGAISLPLFTLFGPDALLHRLSDSGARVVVTDTDGAAVLAGLRDRLPDLKLVLCADGAARGAEDLPAAMAAQPDTFAARTTQADDSAILIYTSGTTGNPKGALHAHRVLPGHLPGVEMSHDFLPQPGDLIWTPADWAWIGGLLDVLMPALHHGVPVLAHRFRKFTGEGAFDLMARHGVRNAFLPPTALKLMRQVADPQPLALRSVASGGETLGAGLIAWGEQTLGCTINEFYGQTECNMIVSSCAALAPAAPGVMGFPVPGHDVRVLGPDGEVPAGIEGDIAVRAPDPVMFLRYWNNPEATARKFRVIGRDRWLLTGDRGEVQPDGRIRFVGRDDDVISSAGYRIGPAEIEDCLLGHPAVQLAGVVGRPDPLRGTVVAAYVKLAAGHAPSPALADQIAAHVRQRLAAYEYPRVVRFVDEMPMTTTGKIMRGRLRALAEAEAATEA